MGEEATELTEESSEAGLVLVAEQPTTDERLEAISEPAKLLRMASMTRSMLAEVRNASLDEEGRARLNRVFHASLDHLRNVLTEDLAQEVEAYFEPLTGEVPSQAEIRIAQAQLVGWLEGLFSGIQAAIMSQQMAARAQLQQIRDRNVEDEPAEAPGGLYL